MNVSFWDVVWVLFFIFLFIVLLPYSLGIVIAGAIIGLSWADMEAQKRKNNHGK